MRMLQCTAFVGDLFAVGALRPSMINTAINVLLMVLDRSPFQHRALCLLLSRCVSTARHRLSTPFILYIRHRVQEALSYICCKACIRWRMVSALDACVGSPC